MDGRNASPHRTSSHGPSGIPPQTDSELSCFPFGGSRTANGRRVEVIFVSPLGSRCRDRVLEVLYPRLPGATMVPIRTIRDPRRFALMANEADNAVKHCGV